MTTARTPFGLIEDTFIERYAKGPALDAEHFHYETLRRLDGVGRMDAINYLYARLTIIDSKASSILAVNTLALGITSLVVTTTGAPVGRGTGSVRVGGVVLGLALAMVAASLVAIFLSLAITRLKFDHVTPMYGVDDYEARFFDITIARQRILAIARLFTGISLPLYATLLTLELWGIRG